MNLRVLYIFSVTVFSGETLPFFNTNPHPSIVKQSDWEFYRPRSPFYSSLSPVKHFPLIVSDQRNLEISAIENWNEKEFDSFYPSSKSLTEPSVSFNEYLIRQQTAEKARKFGHRIMKTIEDYEKRYGEKMKDMKKNLYHKFRLDKMKNKMKKKLLRENTLLKKLHSLGWRGKYVGIPYHTMNDNHFIVKKPCVNIEFYSQPNIDIPLASSVPNIQLIAIQHPVVPEVTTSVNLHQEWEFPETIIPAYNTFPITSTDFYAEEVTETTTEITNLIDKENLTVPEILPSIISNASDYTTTSINPTVDTNQPPTSQTSMPDDLLSENLLETITSSIINTESKNTEIIQTFPSIFSTDATLEIENTSMPPLETTTMVLNKVSTIEDPAFTSIEINPESTSEHFFNVVTTILSETTNFVDELEITNDSDSTLISMISSQTEQTIFNDSGFEDATINMEKSTEIFLDFSSTILPSEMINSDENSSTTESFFDSTTIDNGVFSELTFTHSTVLTITPISEIETLPDVPPKFEYNYFTGSTIVPETTSLLSTTPYDSQIITMTIESLTTVNLPSESSTIDVGIPTENIWSEKTYSTTDETDTTIDPASNSSTSDELPNCSTTLPEITSVPQPALAISTFESALSTFEYNNFPNFTESVQETFGIDSTFDYTISTEISATLQEISTDSTIIPENVSLEEIFKTTNPSYESFTDDDETTTQIISTLPTTTIETEITSLPLQTQTYEYQQFDENEANSEKLIGRLFHENLDLVQPAGFAYNSDEEIDEKTLLNMIPLIIEELREDNVTPEDEHTLKQIFGDLWPLLKEESKRKPDEFMNGKLALFLYEAGQRVSNTNTEKPIEDDEEDIYSFSKLQEFGKQSTISNVVWKPENGFPVRFEEINDDDDAENSDHDKDPNIIELLKI